MFSATFVFSCDSRMAAEGEYDAFMRPCSFAIYFCLFISLFAFTVFKLICLTVACRIMGLGTLNLSSKNVQSRITSYFCLVVANPHDACIHCFFFSLYGILPMFS